jgi:hypothetical protein
VVSELCLLFLQPQQGGVHGTALSQAYDRRKAGKPAHYFGWHPLTSTTLEALELEIHYWYISYIRTTLILNRLDDAFFPVFVRQSSSEIRGPEERDGEMLEPVRAKYSRLLLCPCFHSNVIIVRMNCNPVLNTDVQLVPSVQRTLWTRPNHRHA